MLRGITQKGAKVRDGYFWITALVTACVIMVSARYVILEPLLLHPHLPLRVDGNLGRPRDGPDARFTYFLTWLFACSVLADRLLLVAFRSKRIQLLKKVF